MGSHQLITVPDCYWIIITSTTSLIKMVDNWWHEVTKLLIEKALQNELNTLHNKKIVWDKIGQGMANEGYSGSAQPKINNLKQKYH